jgi:hypothetical protein
MSKFCLIALFSVLFCLQGRAADEFDAINCGANIPKAMVGKYSPNTRVVVTEARHKNLSLKDLGGTEISAQLFVVSWRICGSEYAELVNTKNHLVRDVLRLPAHSLLSPESEFAKCQIAGKEIPDEVIAILDNRQGQKPKGAFEEIMLPAKMAWKIDERRERFVPMPPQGLSCAGSDFGEDVKQ